MKPLKWMCIEYHNGFDCIRNLIQYWNHFLPSSNYIFSLIPFKLLSKSFSPTFGQNSKVFETMSKSLCGKYVLLTREIIIFYLYLTILYSRTFYITYAYVSNIILYCAILIKPTYKLFSIVPHIHNIHIITKTIENKSHWLLNYVF